jgi:lysophospholipase
MTDAPLYNDLAQGPEGGRAYWVTTSDAVRLRMAVWPKGEKGTILLFPGRSEYIEKYGRSNRNKYRAVVYYLLTLHFKKESVYK